MKGIHKLLLGFTLLFAIIAGARWYMIDRENAAANAPVQPKVVNEHLTDDDLVIPRQIYPTEMKDAKTLVGKSIWVNAGGQMDYYPYAGHAIAFTHTAGTLMGADELHVKDVIATPGAKASEVRIPAGNKQVFLIFTKPGDDAKQYAVPVGYVDGTGYTFYLDTLFFYDDPHTLYHWPQPVWDAIAKHEAILGMNERQAMMCLGQVLRSGGTEMGNRTVRYFNVGKPISITFENNKATSIQPTTF